MASEKPVKPTLDSDVKKWAEETLGKSCVRKIIDTAEKREEKMRDHRQKLTGSRDVR